MTNHDRACVHPLASSSRALLALGLSTTCGVFAWACLDTYEPDAPSACTLDTAEACRAAQADAELERLLALVRDGDDDVREVISTGLRALVVGPSDARPPGHPVYGPELRVGAGLDFDDLLDAAGRRFGKGLTDFGHGGRDVSFVDRGRRERVTLRLYDDGTAFVVVEPWLDVADLLGPPSATFAFERVLILGATRDTVAAAFPEPPGSLHTTEGLPVPQTELGADLWVGYEAGVARSFNLTIAYGDDADARLRILRALETHFGVPLAPDLEHELEVSPDVPGLRGSLQVWDIKAGGFILVWRASLT